MGYEFLTHAATELVCISCRSPRTKWCEVFNRLILKLRRQSACTEAIYDNLRESLSGLKSWLWWGKRFKTSKDRTSLSFINIHLIVIRSKESSSKSSSSTFKHFLFSIVHGMSSFPVTNSYFSRLANCTTKVPRLRRSRSIQMPSWGFCRKPLEEHYSHRLFWAMFKVLVSRLVIAANYSSYIRP